MTTTRKKTELDTTPSGRDPIGDWLDVLESMLGVPAARRRAIRQELEDHLRSRVDDLTITGLSEPEAVRAAVGELGETADLARRFREAAAVNRRRLWMHAAIFGLVGGAIAIGTVGVTGGLNQPGSGGAGGAGGAAAGTFAGEVEFASNAFEGIRRYSVHGLGLSDEPLGTTPAGERLVESITDLVKPAEWERFGGESRIKLLGNTLFVVAPADVQEGVEWVLASLEEDAERLRAERERRAEEVVESRRAVVEGRVEELNAELERVFDQLGDLSDRSTLIQRAMAQSNPFGRSELTEEQQREGGERSMKLIRENSLIEAERKLLNQRIERIREVLLDLEYGVPGRPDLAASTMAMSDGALPAPQSNRSASRGDSDRRAALTEEKQRLETERVAIDQRLGSLRAESSRVAVSPFESVPAQEEARRSARLAELEHEAATLELRLKDVDARLERVRQVLLDVEYGRAADAASDADAVVGASISGRASGSTLPAFDPEPTPASFVPALTGEQMSDRLRAKRRELAVQLGQLESLRHAMTRTESIDQRRNMEQSETSLLRTIRGVEHEIARLERSIAERSPTPRDKGGGLIYVVAAWNDNEPMTFGLPANGRLKVDQVLRGLDIPTGNWELSLERAGAPSATVAVEDLLSGKVESGFIEPGDLLELSAAD